MAVAQRVLNFTPLADMRSDRALVRSAQSGKSEAASVLIERYYPRVRSFVSYLVGGKGNVDDLTQEVFTRALAALGRFNGNYRFGPWVYRIAKNLCIDEARRSNFRPDPADPAELPLLEATPRGSDLVWESISSQIASSIVRRAMARLPWRQRTALILKEIEGMSYSEISEVIGAGVRGVEATLRRARANFRMAVARLEEADVEKASCVRTLRLIADDPSKAADLRTHLRSCPNCRSRSSSMSSADKLLGMLPPFALGAPGVWKLGLAERVATRSVSKRGVLEVLRGHPGFGLASPFGQIAQYAASLTVAASISVASVTGAVRVVAAAGAPDLATAPYNLASKPAASFTGSASNRIRLAPEVDAGVALPDASVAGQIDAAIIDVRLGSRVAELVRAADRLAGAASIGQDGLPSGVPKGPSDLPDIPGTAVLPASVSLPRRRPHRA